MARFKKGSASAKAYMAKLRAMVGKSRTRTAPKERLKGEKSKPKKKVKTLAKKKGRRRLGEMTIPLAVVTPLVYGIGEPLKWAAMDGMPIDEAGRHILMRYTGFNAWAQKWDPLNPRGLALGLFPLIVGAMVHKFVGGKPLNINAMLARAKVPFIRI